MYIVTLSSSFKKIIIVYMQNISKSNCSSKHSNDEWMDYTLEKSSLSRRKLITSNAEIHSHYKHQLDCTSLIIVLIGCRQPFGQIKRPDFMSRFKSSMSTTLTPTPQQPIPPETPSPLRAKSDILTRPGTPSFMNRKNDVVSFSNFQH